MVVFPQGTTIRIESKDVDLSGMEFSMVHDDGDVTNDEFVLLTEEGTDSLFAQLGFSFRVTLMGRALLEESYFIGRENNPFGPRPVDKAVGACPECGSMRHWYNNVPLTAYCWGTSDNPHEEWSERVPLGDLLDMVEGTVDMYSPFTVGSTTMRSVVQGVGTYLTDDV